MAAHPRRARRRSPNATEPQAKGQGGALSPAFHHLLRCLTPVTAAQVSAASTWGWQIRLIDNALRARPVWVGAEGPQPMTWTGTAWTPKREGGWTVADRLALLGVTGTAQPDKHEILIRHAEQMEALSESLDIQGGWLDTPQGPDRMDKGAPCDVISHWETNAEQGLTLVQEEGFSPRWVVFAGERVWKIDRVEDGRALRPVREGAEALLWAQRYQRLSAEDLKAWAMRFAHDERLAKLPLPQDKPTVVVEDAPRLVAQIVSTGDARTFHLGMHLQVAYGDTVVSLHGPDVESVTREDGALAIVHRNRSIERRTLNAIGNANLRVWPHPFSKRDAFPFGWPVDWLADKARTWVGSEPPPADLSGWFAQAQKLEALGVEVRWDAKLPFARAQSDQRWTAHVEQAGRGKSKWLEAGVGVDVDGEKMDLTGALVALLNDAAFPHEKAEDEPEGAVWLLELPRATHGKLRYLDVPLQRLRQLLAPLRGGDHRQDERGTRLRLAPAALNEVSAWATEEVHVDTHLEALWKHLREGFSPRTDPDGFVGTLRSYQNVGLGWLHAMAELGWGGELADDMGLGKTVQILAHLQDEHNLGRLERPALLVVPASLMHNWKDEAGKYTPNLRVITLHGNEKHEAMKQLDDAQIVITTYQTMLNILDQLVEREPFSLAIFDEAQALKNPRSQISAASRKVPAQRKITLSGTPLENHLGELWAQMDLAMPGLLGSREAFRTRFQNPIEKRNDPTALARLRAMLAPVLLRRHKSEVAKDLPPKTETVVRLDLGEGQRLLYESIRAAQKARVEQAIAEKGLAGASFTVLDALLRMRQACCEPSLLDGGTDVDSVKRQFLLDRLEGMLDEGRRVLVVSSFTQVLDKIAADLKKQQIPFAILTGDTPVEQRKTVVDRFQNGEVGVFLISLKAGGVGLNLTAADTVVHYDPWWNPAAENQATDRAHRIGQDKPVFVYRLICNDTLEEHILTMQQRKSDLADAVLDGLGKGATGLTEADLSLLFGG